MKKLQIIYTDKIARYDIRDKWIGKNYPNYYLKDNEHGCGHTDAFNKFREVIQEAKESNSKIDSAGFVVANYLFLYPEIYQSSTSCLKFVEEFIDIFVKQNFGNNIVIITLNADILEALHKLIAINNIFDKVEFIFLKSADDIVQPSYDGGREEFRKMFEDINKIYPRLEDMLPTKVYDLDMMKKTNEFKATNLYKVDI